RSLRVAASRPIVGVLPPGFRFPDQTDVWVSANGQPQPRSAQNFRAAARLKPGVSLASAQTEMISIAGHLEQQYPDSNKGQSVNVTRMQDEMVDNVRRA